ncbi:hypothetical protein HQ531_07585 [bacterium]|nr:hypothetical protein [bacterium]
MQEILNDRDHVYRITVDEQLSETQFRVLISRASIKEINTAQYDKEWEDEVEYCWSYEEIWELIKAGKPDIAVSKWKPITEGQVYLAGMFDWIEGGLLKLYLGNAKKFSIVLIDYLIKDTIRKLYEDALIGGGNYVETDLK